MTSLVTTHPKLFGRRIDAITAVNSWSACTLDIDLNWSLILGCDSTNSMIDEIPCSGYATP